MGDVFLYIGVAPTIGIAAIGLIMAHNCRHTPSSLCSTHRPYIRPLARLQAPFVHKGPATFGSPSVTPVDKPVRSVILV